MPRTIRIGRAVDNDVVVSNPTVSKYHAVVTIGDNNSSAVVRDLGSKNGTYVNGVRISGAKEIGLSDKLSFGAAGYDLSTLVGSTRVVPRSGNGKVIGRDSSCDICLPHDDVSKRHASLSQRSDGQVYIEDLGSTNGTYVNGERVTSRVLRSGDKVTITRNYPLNWEAIYAPPRRRGGVKSKTLLYISAAVVALLVVCGVTYYFMSHRSWSAEKTYEKYGSAVCLVYGSYGYKIYLDDDDVTSMFCSAYGLEESSVVSWYADASSPSDTRPVSGAMGYTGTAFFISTDGKLGTNLHITCPWLDHEAEMKSLEGAMNYLVAYLSQRNPLLSRSTVSVRGVLVGIGIIPNGLPVAQSNLIECTIVKNQDDLTKDVAVLQTVSRSLPPQVTNIIDYTKSDTSDEAYKEGKPIYTIGFPLGWNIGLDSNQDLQNQVHSGTVTQSRGEYTFGHDAAIQHGSSGSPIFNDKGQLIGVVNAGVTSSQGFNTGVKVKYLIDLLQ